MSEEKNQELRYHPVKRFNIVVSVLMFVAIIFGVFGQNIAYYIGRNLEGMSPVYCLTALTVISIILFLVVAILASKHIKRGNRKQSKSIKVIIIISFAIGIVVSVFSTFATIMWWG